MKMTTLDPKNLDSTSIYKLLIGTIIPRPIAFVSTMSSKGIGNLAPFSFYNGVASNPPSIMFAITRKSDGGKKDTLINIEETREFVINFVNEALGPKMNQTSAAYPYGVDEMSKVGLTPLPSLIVKPKRVAESPVHLECKLYDTLEVGKGDAGSSTIVVGEIVQFHLSNSVYETKTGRVDAIQLSAISRLAGNQYARVNDLFEMPRPKI